MTTTETAIGTERFTVELSGPADRRPAPAHRRDTLARQGARRRPVAGRPAGDAAELARYWVEDYDFGRLEARLNALPQFMTEIDGVDIHFIHVRSQHENALPLIITHGWPGSVLEMLEVIGPLTDPTAHGGDAADAFHVVIPSHARLRLLVGARPSSAGTPAGSRPRGRS